jgi:hypothetical protein
MLLTDTLSGEAIRKRSHVPFESSLYLSQRTGHPGNQNQLFTVDGHVGGRDLNVGDDFNVWSLKKRGGKISLHAHESTRAKTVRSFPRPALGSFAFYSNLGSGLIRVDPAR